VKVWADIGLQPFDRNCLQDDKVKNKVVTLPDGTFNVDSDHLCTKLLNTEDLNKKATDLLTLHDLDRNVFRKRAPRFDVSTTKTTVIAPLFREGQDILMDASSAGSCFHTTGGDYLNLDDYIMS